MRHAREEYLFQYAYNIPVFSQFWHCLRETILPVAMLNNQSGWLFMYSKAVTLDD